MAQKYGFFNSINHDRVYDASDVAKYISKFFTNGVFNNGMNVTSNDNMTVSVAVGNANINGYAYELTDNALVLDIDEADDELGRIDSVIVRLDLTNRQITTQILQGSYATTPSQPSITRTSTVYDLRLANISVPAGATRITQEMITDTRLSSDCGNVVQAVQYLDTDDIFLQYQTAWNNWFANIQDQLDDNQAGHLQNQIGTLSELDTTTKTDLVSAVNETKGMVDSNSDSIGDLSNLDTTEKSSIVGAVNETLGRTNYIVLSKTISDNFTSSYKNVTWQVAEGDTDNIVLGSNNYDITINCDCKYALMLLSINTTSNTGLYWKTFKNNTEFTTQWEATEGSFHNVTCIMPVQKNDVIKSQFYTSSNTNSSNGNMNKLIIIIFN